MSDRAAQISAKLPVMKENADRSHNQEGVARPQSLLVLAQIAVEVEAHGHEKKRDRKMHEGRVPGGKILAEFHL